MTPRRRRLVSVVVAILVTAATPFAQPSQLGQISFPTSGSAAAQPHFIRGVLLLHSFEYDDAIAAFREAQRIDPGFAMAYWGEAMSYNQPLWRNENLDRARATLTRLAPTSAARAGKVRTAREKGYLDAVERLFGPGDLPARARRYADRMAQLTRENPDDDEAAAFYALALLATIPREARNPEVSLKAGSIASAILKRNPQHPGAAHYALHAYDDGEHAKLGLAAAKIYARIAPASSHARHMPSHIFLPLGMWDEASASDESAFAASVDWVKRHGASVAQQDFHSLGWLHYESLQQGRFAKARELLEPVRRALAELGRPPDQPPPRLRRSAEALRAKAEGGRYDNPSVASGAVSSAASGFGRTDGGEHQHVESEIGRGYGPMSLRSELGSMRARLVVESGDWAQMKGQGTFDGIDELFALGYASVKLGDLARAETALEHLNVAGSMPPGGGGGPDLTEIAAIMAAELDGVLRSARRDRTGASAALARAVALEGKRPRPIARPYPIKPAAELYGEVLLADGDAAGAVKQFRAALARTPRRAASLLGLARAAKATGLKVEAANAAREFLAIWHRADPGRSEIGEARAMSGENSPPRRK